jgi:hypothetical protein
MKYYKSLKKIIIVLVILISTKGFAQTSAAAVQVAEKIAQKMKDSLALTDAQRGQLYTVNMQLHNLKKDARTQYASTPTVMATKIQDVEKTRDSLYQPILTAAQFTLYEQKKKNLVSNN